MNPTTQSRQLASRFREIFDGSWIANTNLKEQLQDVTLPIAIARVSHLNTIALLTFHLNYYIAGVLQLLKGGDLTIRDQYSFNLPRLNSEDEWQALKNQLFYECGGICKTGATIT